MESFLVAAKVARVWLAKTTTAGYVESRGRTITRICRTPFQCCFPTGLNLNLETQRKHFIILVSRSLRHSVWKIATIAAMLFALNNPAVQWKNTVITVRMQSRNALIILSCRNVRPHIGPPVAKAGCTIAPHALHFQAFIQLLQPRALDLIDFLFANVVLHRVIAQLLDDHGTAWSQDSKHRALLPDDADRNCKETRDRTQAVEL